MNIDELRLKVQNALKSERGVTDVAFTPLSHDVEMVSFHEDGARAHFAVVMSTLEKMPYSARSISLMAEAALGSAKVHAAELAAKEVADRAAEASKQVRVLAA